MGDARRPRTDPSEPEPSAPDPTRIGLGATPEGDNSAYLLADRGVVVDPGPPTGDAWARLRAGIRSETTLDAVDHVLVTHWHVDHAGLAPRLAEVADATVYLHERDAPLVADYAAERDRRLSRDRERLLAWGVPADLVSALVDGDAPSPIPDSSPVESLADGDRVAGVECLHAPGHTAGHAAFLVGPTDATGAGSTTTDDASWAPVALVGDLVLPETTPNVGGGDTRMRNPLPTYLDSLDRLARRAGVRMGGADADANAKAEIDAAEPESGRGGPARPVFHPGHGTAFPPAARLEKLRTHHAARLDRCVEAVGDGCERDGVAPTPWAVATDLFGEMAGVHAKMGAGEAASHLAAAAAADRIERVGEDPVRYAPA